MKELIKKINAIFIKLILIFFYIFIIGIGALIQRVFKLFSTGRNSYWIDGEKKIRNIDYFQSPY